MMVNAIFPVDGRAATPAVRRSPTRTQRLRRSPVGDRFARMRAGAFFIAGLVLLATRAAATNLDPICPDRPGKGTGTCTVPAGHWQVETGLIDWTHDRSGGVRSDFTMIASSLVKYGVSDRADIELGITPYEVFRVR